MERHEEVQKDIAKDDKHKHKHHNKQEDTVDTAEEHHKHDEDDPERSIVYSRIVAKTPTYVNAQLKFLKTLGPAKQNKSIR